MTSEPSILGAAKDLAKVDKYPPKDDVSDETAIPDDVLGDDGIRRDTFFYHIPLVILVEGTLFKIPRAYFETHSEVFRDTHLRPYNPLEGLTDEQPLRLDGVDASEFRCLIKAMIQRDLEEDIEMPLMDWIAVLKLALAWEMRLIEDWAIRKITTQIHSSTEWTTALILSAQLKIPRLRVVAIQSLTHDLSPLPKFQLAMECCVDSWLFEVYATFVNRPQSISDEDAEKLGWERTSLLFRLRHRRFEHLQAYDAYVLKGDLCRNSNGVNGGVLCGCPPCHHQPFEQWYDVGIDIRTTFAGEFADIAAFNNSPRASPFRSDLRTVAGFEAMHRDGTYYLADIIFLVEDTLFKVPRHLFEQSSNVFRDMFKLPAAEGMAPDGETDEQPLHLKGVQKEDFRQLLKLMTCPVSNPEKLYGDLKDERPIRHLKKGAEKEAPMRWQKWASLVRLSCMWEMDKIREKAVKKVLEHKVTTHEQIVLLRLATDLTIPELRDPVMQKLSPNLRPIEMVELGIEFHLHTWLLRGYSSLALEEGGITIEDGERLGPKTTSKLFRVRELLFQKILNSHTIPGEIKRVFSAELKDAGWDGK